MPGKIIKSAGLGLVMGVMFFLLVYVFMMIWNMTMPDIFGFKVLNYWQALGLLAVSRILIGGFGFRWSNNSEKGKFWRERMKMKTQNMTEDEKAEFKRRLWQKCKDW